MSVVFLYAPQEFRNLCLLSRTLEVFGHRDCFVFDPHHLVRDRYGKVRTREMRALSAGAFQKIRWQRVEQPEQFLREHPGRLVATVAAANAVPLDEFRFAPTDLLLFGSESSGLPPDIIAASAAAVTIPASGETQSLNLAVSVGIVLFERQRQLKP
jgi:tRNA(Leu) C34 or U34 (ribose-2'-O)-methylase TrmL